MKRMKQQKLIFIVLASILFLGTSCSTTRKTTSKKKPSLTGQDYIEQYKDIAIREMRKTGIPASIKLAQGMLESNYGNSTLATEANNHFGIKCHNDWKGRRIYHDDDRKNECFRKYDHPIESFQDHSRFLTEYSRYAFLFDYETTDYKAWAKGLKKAGYATSPTYAGKLIEMIERYKLYNFDAGPRARVNYEQETTELGNVDDYEISTPGHTVQNRNRIDYIIVREGDTYKSLTEELELMPWELQKYNELNSRHNIKPGQILYLQPKRNKAARGYEIHIVKEDDTMHSISQMYGIKLDKLYKKNRMKEGTQPKPGTTIYLRSKKPLEETEKTEEKTTDQ
jgi:LysM repeat protein